MPELSPTAERRGAFAQLSEHAWSGAGLIALLALCAHAPSLLNGYIWDDPDYVINNVQLRSLHGLWAIWTVPRVTPQYYPLVHSTFWIEYQLWGLAPLHFHLFNILLHALAAVLLWRCLRFLSLPGALVAACVFAVHPVQVESVAWITERKNVLCGVFYFGAALTLLPVVLTRGEPAAFPVRRYAAGVVLFVLAMLSKTVACSLGAVLLLIAWWKTGTLRRRDAALLGPLLAIGAGLGALTAWLERTHVGAEGPEWAFSFADRCIIAGRSLAFYVQGLLLPGERVFMPERWTIDDHAPLQYLYPLAVVLLIAALWALRARIGRGPLVAVLIYAGVLLPALGFFNIYPMRYAFAFDHFQYLAVPAPVALLVAAFASAAAASGARARMLAGIAAGLLLASYCALSFRQSQVYFSEETLWRHTLEHNPKAWIAHRHLGKIALDKGNPSAAVIFFAEAARLRPTDEAAFNNLAIAYGHLGQFDRAVTALRQSIRLRPGYAPTYKNLAVALSLSGHDADARAALAQYQQMMSTAQARRPARPR